MNLAIYRLFSSLIGGRKALYELLGKIYVLAKHFDQSLDKADLIKMMRKALQEQFGIKTQENTPNTTVLVRYITRADRKTAHVYSRAIEIAQESGIEPENFIAYIERSGGVERIREIGISDDVQEAKNSLEQEKLDLTHSFLGARTEIPFATFDAPKAFEGIYANNCTYEFVICSLGTDSKYKVIGKLPADKDFENLAIKYFTKYLCQNIEQAREGVAKVVASAYRKKQSQLNSEISN